MLKKTLIMAVLLVFAACGEDDPSTNNSNNGNNANNVNNTNQNNTNNANNPTNNANNPTNNANNPTNNANNGMDMGVEDMSTADDMGGGDDMAGGDDAGTDMAQMMDMAPDMPAPDGETCDAAIDATNGLSLTGQTTVGFDDDYDSPIAANNCPSGTITGPDVVYSVSPTQATIYDITVTPMGNFDVMLYVREDCTMDACIDGTVLNGPGTAENLEINVPAGATYYIIVDGEFTVGADDEGMYDIDIAVQ